MQRKQYDLIQETLYSKTLPNGLQVLILPKADYHKVYGIFTTHFGSNIQKIRNRDTQELHEIPAGAAHFLEHKLFEGPDGEDAFQLFMHQGANANAFTNNHQTSYLFDGSFDISQNIEILLDFVQNPAFTPEGVAKEKGIITQEILMYLDQPISRGLQALMEHLYPNHPAGMDITGSVESVNATTYEALKLAYDTFYHPSQMVLVIVGQVDPEATMELIAHNQAGKTFQPTPFEGVFDPIEAPPLPPSHIEMAVAQPFVFAGLRMDAESLPSGQDRLRLELVSDIFLELLMGPSSPTFQAWLNDAIIDANFGFNIEMEPHTHHLLMYTTSMDAEATLKAWQSHLSQWQHSAHFTREAFAQVVRGTIGDHLQLLNSLEGIAYNLTDGALNHYDVLASLSLLKEISFDEVLAYGEQYFQAASWTSVTLQPKKS